jgi:hypothetical protein
MVGFRMTSLAVVGIAVSSCAADGRTYAQPEAGSFELVTEQLTIGQNAEAVQGARVSPSFATSTGVVPFLGRFFIDADFAAPGRSVVVLHHELWQSRFGGNPTLIGRAVDVNGQPHTVAGVAPPGFDFPKGARYWLPRSSSQP